MSHTVLILGASYAGLTVAHKLLKHTRPTIKDLKVILVNPSTHFYWNLASVRAIVPGQVKDSEILSDIASGFKYAPSESFELVVGRAEAVDVDGRVVSITTVSGQWKQSYDILVVATGSKMIGEVPWKAIGTYEETRERLRETRQKVEKAKSIVVAGGGPTGVELAGELGFEYGGKKDIRLITSGHVVMEGAIVAHIAKSAEKELEKLHVKIIRRTKVADATTTSKGQTEITLENGQKFVADLFLPTFGLSANSEFLPKKLLNSKGELMLNHFLRAKGSTSIWAAGDIGDLQRNGFMITNAQAQHLAKNLDLVLHGKEPVAYKIPTKSIVAVSLGRSKGTGSVGGWKLPSLAVWLAKGRTLALQKMPGVVSGSSF